MSRQSIEGNNNTQALGNIHYSTYIGSADTNPKEIELVAVKDFTVVYYIISFVMAIPLFYILIQILSIVTLSSLKSASSIVITILIILAIFISVLFVLTSLEKIYKKYTWGHVKYHNKSLEYQNRTIKFYDEIWRINLEKTWSGNGRIEYFAVSQKTNKIYSRKIVFSNFSHAQYLYDVFWNKKNVVDGK